MRYCAIKDFTSTRVKDARQVLDASTLNVEMLLDGLLPPKVTTILAKSGIRTVGEIRSAYPDGLMKIRGIGMLRLKQIEITLFPGISFTPERARSPIAYIKGSSLNGSLSPAAVRALGRGGIITVQQLREVSRKRLLNIQGLGQNLLREIERTFLTEKS